MIIIENNEIKNKEETNINKPKQTIQNMKNNRRIQMATFPFSDIPNIDKEFIHDEYDPPNINKLRKDKEEEIKRKEKEAKKKKLY